MDDLLQWGWEFASEEPAWCIAILSIIGYWFRGRTIRRLRRNAVPIDLDAQIAAIHKEAVEKILYQFSGYDDFKCSATVAAYFEGVAKLKPAPPPVQPPNPPEPLEVRLLQEYRQTTIAFLQSLSNGWSWKDGEIEEFLKDFNTGLQAFMADNRREQAQAVLPKQDNGELS